MFWIRSIFSTHSWVQIQSTPNYFTKIEVNPCNTLDSIEIEMPQNFMEMPSLHVSLPSVPGISLCLSLAQQGIHTTERQIIKITRLFPDYTIRRNLLTNDQLGRTPFGGIYPIWVYYAPKWWHFLCIIGP